ncbi:ribokinase [Fontivita pretiosa]|uniref:ribokinase n=1 Tax=Fontivita pretiosa TaxID=2989684 RepID=UPI003D173148
MPDSSRHIVVIGSINMDLVCRTPSIPQPGQTILGYDFMTIPGGKGANQAVAAAKLSRPGSKVYMVGRVGDDDFGQRLLNGLVNHGVDTTHVTITEGLASGVAMILVDRKGENSIVVAPGANAKLTPRDVDAAEGVISSAAAVLMQLEIPHETVMHAIAMCRRLGVYTILDPAPAARLPRAMMEVDLIVPNQSEAEILLGLDRSITRLKRVKRKGVIDPKQVASTLLAKGPRAVVLKLGARGSILLERDGTIQTFKPFKVKVVDTTAAGDAFAGALAVARAEGMQMPEAMYFANAAGALCCENFGAQPALPSRQAVEKLLASR